ncbi:hypothetical protein EV356DRAFT_526809 [Viridothelium virens]|uniref:F-box domain-containing protein n=1 Tax=Viridothelium virens TaxID=1048519 RepID=A0A6A6GYB8_VIRVR|nr:hypothetical protein EV356DRAFT_526809 [Viridothelium virens]
MESRQKTAPLLSLPTELLHEIITYLPTLTLVDLLSTCRDLRTHALEDSMWQKVINANLPSIAPLASPHPYPSFRTLYATFHPNWFLPKNKLWIADNAATGKLLLARYDPQRAVIEAHSLVAERGMHTFSLWAHDDEVIIHTFSPKVQLDLNSPAIRLGPYAHADGRSCGIRESPLHKRLQREIPMDTHTGPGSQGIYSTFMLTRPLDPSLINPGTSVWPPQIIPAGERARNESAQQFNAIGHKPSCLSEMSTGTFRLRKWMQFGTSRIPGHGGISMRMGEDVVTYGTLKEEAYTPTLDKPWQGIWVGDYSGHGCEFLLVTQPNKEDERPLPEGVRQRRSQAVLSTAYFDTGTHAILNPYPLTVLNASDETELEAVEEEEEITAEKEHGHYGQVESSDTRYRGRLEAIKLTGDPNVPRGEYTFIAPDIGSNGLIRTATEDPFRGARIVKSAGHIAGSGFRDDQYIATQLIMISHDRLAQYWEQFGHISFYQRVNVDALVRGDVSC